MSQSLESVKRHGQRVVDAFNKRFTPNTPCFYQPTRGLDKWYPTRTRSAAWMLGHGEPVVQIDGTSGCVSIEHLAMPGSTRYEEAKLEADQVWEDWVNELVEVVADNAPAPAAITMTALTTEMYSLLLKADASPSVLNIVSEFKSRVEELQEAGQVSDGYHTFTELYAHRVRLFSCLMHAHKNRAWWSHKHSDGTQWDGWIIAGIATPAGMTTYHLPVTEIEHLPEGIELPEGKPWDGHKAEDVLTRLPSLNFGRTDGTAFEAPVEEELAVYQYAISVNTPQGEIHADGILQVPMIATIEDYQRCRAEMASDVGATPEQIQVRSMSVIGSVPAAAPAPAQEAAQ